MRQEGREADLSCRLVDHRGLDRGDLVLAQAFADNIEAVGERGIAEGLIRLPGKWRADSGGASRNKHKTYSSKSRPIYLLLEISSAQLVQIAAGCKPAARLGFGLVPLRPLRRDGRIGATLSRD